MGIWSSLVRLAGSGEGVIPAVFGTLAQSHVLSGPPAKTAKRTSSSEGTIQCIQHVNGVHVLSIIANACWHKSCDILYNMYMYMYVIN